MKVLSYYFFCLTVLILHSNFLKAQMNCEKTFSSGLQLINQVKGNIIQDRKLHSRFMDPQAEHKLQEKWNEESTAPSFLNFALPKDVHYIDHQLTRSESEVAIKLANRDTIMARASYQFKGRTFATNVAFSSEALLSNMQSTDEKKWLVGEDASAAFLSLHGMGMQTTGAHIAKRIIRDVRTHLENVHVLALDLSWHAEGHREVLSLSEEVMLLSAFVKKYIPPNVPLFIWGHSGGTVLAQKLMTMTDGSQGGRFFHPNLKGIMLFSPVIDAAPGKSTKEKYKAYSEGQKKGLSEQPEQPANPLEVQLFEDSNPLGELYSMWMITQLSGVMPSHRGRNYIPSFMAIGKGDYLVFKGFPITLFHEYYDQLENMDTYYLDRLPLLRTKKEEEVNHWLGEYMDPESKLPIQIVLARQFMEKQLGMTFDKTNKEDYPSILGVIGDFSNTLTFRQFLDQYRFLNAELNSDIRTLNNRANKRVRDEVGEILQKYDLNNIPPKRILGKIFSSQNFEQLIESLNSLSLPDPLLKEITEYVTKTGYFEIKQLAQGMYLPTQNDLLKRGLINATDKAKMESLLTELSEGLSERVRLTQELSTSGKWQGKLKEQYKQTRNSVRIAFKTIEKGLKEVSKQPPPSLVSAFISIRNELETVETLGDEIIELFEGLSVQMTAPYSLSQMHSLVRKHQAEIDHFQQLYYQYDRNRQNLKKQVIQVMAKGEIGQQYQQVVLDIYGQNLDGQGPLYSKLKDITQELDQMTVDIYQINILYNESLMRHQDIFEQLFPLLQPVEKESTDWIDMARNSYTFSDTSIHDVSKSVDSQNKLEIDQYEPFFKNVLETWKQWQSISMPDLSIN